ncbi:DUF6444 domain-containing protein [Streptomyces chiangmaiensis]
MSDLESLSREELIVLAQRQDAQITLLATQLAELMEKFEQQAAELARLQHLLSRNSGNSSMPPSKDDGPGRATPRKERRAKPSGRAKGKQPGASGTALRWRGGRTRRPPGPLPRGHLRLRRRPERGDGPGRIRPVPAA